MIRASRLVLITSGLLFGLTGLPTLKALDILYVTLLNNTVVKYDTSGTSLGVFANTQMSQPRGLVFDPTGNLYVANQLNNTISKYNSSGVYQSKITSNVSSPQGLAYYANNLYAANGNSTGISKFNASGGFVSTVASSVYQSHAEVFDNLGNLYISYGSQVDKYNSSGTYLSTITTGIDFPYGLATDSARNLYVANSNNNTITKYNSSGTLLSTISQNVNSPIGITLDSQGYLYVVNNGLVITKYSPAGAYLTTWNLGTSGSYITFQTVPEPGTWALGAIGAGILAMAARRRKARATA